MEATKPENVQDAAHVEEALETTSHTVHDDNDLKVTWKDFLAARRVIMWCFLIFLLPINFGYELSTVGNLLAVPAFLNRFGKEVDGEMVILARDQQILNAATTAGLFISAFTVGLLADKFGRKRVIISSCTICIAGILTQYFAKSIDMLFGGKLLGTFGFGLGHSLGPVYVAEIAPVKLRGVCLALINTMIVLGQWLNSVGVYASSSRTTDLAWRIPIITQMIPPGLLLLIAVPLLPESPSWLIMRGRHDEAARSFRRFHGSAYDVDLAVTTMAAAYQQEQEIESSKSAWLECFKGSNGRRTLLICMVYIAQQVIGVNFIAGYLTYYFKLAGVHNAIGIAQAAYAIQLFGNICSWPLIDRLGRRPLIIGGMIIMTAGLLVVGGVSTIKTPPGLKATVSFMTLWGFLYQATLGAVAYSIGGETPSVRLRQKTYSINIMSATAVSCAVLQIMPYLINPDEANLGGKIAFVFFAPSVPMCIYLFYCLPEMKGRTYLEIQEMFTNGVPARKFSTYKCQSTAEVIKMQEIMAEEKQS